MRNLTLYELSVGSSYCDNVRCFKLYDSLQIICEAWREVMGSTVVNCFRKAIDNWEYAYMTNNGVQFEDGFLSLTGEKTSYDEYENYRLYDDSFVDDQEFYDKISPKENLTIEEEPYNIIDDELVSYSEAISSTRKLRGYIMQNMPEQLALIGQIEDLIINKIGKKYLITEYALKKK